MCLISFVVSDSVPEGENGRFSRAQKKKIVRAMSHWKRLGIRLGRVGARPELMTIAKWIRLKGLTRYKPFEVDDGFLSTDCVALEIAEVTLVLTRSDVVRRVTKWGFGVLELTDGSLLQVDCSVLPAKLIALIPGPNG